ncbi:hypothetical protein JTB14_005902 [Gonioctena quinquepunctata]|nr:hypothetical protein JTB14_005902 [Gonioctena quinquepunctata]
MSEDPTLSESEEDSVLIEENEDNNIELCTKKVSHYIIASFPGKNIEHKLVCMIQELCSYGEFEVMQACNEARTP